MKEYTKEEIQELEKQIKNYSSPGGFSGHSFVAPNGWIIKTEVYGSKGMFGEPAGETVSVYDGEKYLKSISYIFDDDFGKYRKKFTEIMDCDNAVDFRTSFDMACAVAEYLYMKDLIEKDGNQ